MAESGPRRPVRDRDAVLAAALVVAGVLIVAWVSGLIPALHNTVLGAPVVIVGLILVTAAVLLRTVRPR